MAPSSTTQWTVEGTKGFESLQLNEAAEIPPLGDHDVLVHFYYASLNYRDLIITQGKYPMGARDHIVPGSDGAGVVEATGSRVTRFKPGDKVVTLFNQDHLAGPITIGIRNTGLGGLLDGTLRKYGTFHEQGLVAMPVTLDFQQASTLSCAAVTAWNAFYGLESRALKPGDIVLTQGTGGVSIFALQFAKAAGARVIATTSTSAKAEILTRLGADHVLNYTTDPHWGDTAKNLTPGKAGVHHVIEVGGPTTMTQSLRAVRPEGVISIIGFLGGMRQEDQPTFLECLSRSCTVRGVMVGSRAQFEAMNEAVDACGLKPVVDRRVFGMREAREAYQYMWEKKHLGKITIKIDSPPDQSKL